jgi:hypothetical protein
MGHIQYEDMLRFKPSLRATLRVGGFNECEGGMFMDALTIECTTMPTFCFIANKCVAYNLVCPPLNQTHVDHIQV